MGNCDRDDAGSMVLPLIPAEDNWPNALRAVIYGVGLAWLFLAVAIVSDLFMDSIEHITSSQKVVTDKTGARVLVRVWNATVANLTLMALGSSAPEILLALVETVGNDFYAGDLGPSTIVGSAAFNLLVIIAVCVVAIPEEIEGGRKIDDLGVYAVTAVSSLFAYFWMTFVLHFNTPDVVELWEAALTFAFFPIMVIIAYMVDAGWVCGKRDTQSHVVSISDGSEYLTSNEISLEDMVEALDKGALSKLTEEEKEMVLMLKAKASADDSKPKSRREKARALKKKQEQHQRAGDPLQSVLGVELMEKIKTLSLENGAAEDEEKERLEAQQVVRFVSPEYSCMENDGSVTVGVTRFPSEGVLRVDYKTVEDTATGDEDYKSVEGTLVFRDGESLKTIKVEIIDDDEVEEDEQFYVVVENARPNAHIAVNQTCVTIIDDDLPGEFGFDQKDTSITCSEATGVVKVPVTRRNGASGSAEVTWSTEDVTALEGTHYVKSYGTLCFGPGEMVHEIEVRRSVGRSVSQSTFSITPRRCLLLLLLVVVCLAVLCFHSIPTPSPHNPSPLTRC